MIEDEDERSEAYLIPVEQESIPFQGRAIVAVRLADGRIAVIIRWLCEGFGLEPRAQIRRIKRDDDGIADDLVYVQVDTETRGKQVVAALILRSVQVWLAAISPNQVSEETRPIIKALKREAVEVLREHFEKKRQQQMTSPTALVPLERPAIDADPYVVADYLERLAALIRQQAITEQQVREIASQLETHTEQISDLYEQVGELHDRTESNEELSRMLADAATRLAPQTLTPEHQASVQAAVNRLHDLTGSSHATIYNDLRQSFRVGTYKQIPDARWPDLTAWFARRLEAAEKRRR